MQTLTERLMTYALGRTVEYYDMPTVRKIVREAARDKYRFSSIVMGIVRSDAVPDAHGAGAGTSVNVTASLTTASSADHRRDLGPETGDRRRDMFITKKHLSRRTFLRGAGVAVGLPLLDAMVPAWTALAAHRRGAEASYGLHVSAARRDHGALDAGR